MKTLSQNSSKSGSEPREKFANGLGWFSVGLGIAKILAPKGLAELIGVRNRPAVFRALSPRELLSGVGILRNTNGPAGFGRVSQATSFNYEETSTLEALNEMTGGRGPDSCIDAVGMERIPAGLFISTIV